MYRKSFLIFSIILLILFSFPALAVENDFGLWVPTYINLPITEKVKSQLEVTPRIQDNLTEFSQLLIRPSVGYQLTKELSIWQGYGWITNYIPKFASENRIWQQLLYEKHFKRFPRFSLVNRFRVEERFFEDVNGVPVRLRNMLRLQYALGKKQKWSLVLFDEPFINLGKTPIGPNGIDQNRLFVGLNRKVTKDFNYDFGYLMQYINRFSPIDDRLNHNILINFYLTLPQVIKAE